METKTLGIILSIMGITGLILALINVNLAASSNHATILVACGIAGTIAFFAGLRLIPDPKVLDKAIKVSANKIPE